MERTAGAVCLLLLLCARPARANVPEPSDLAEPRSLELPDKGQPLASARGAEAEQARMALIARALSYDQRGRYPEAKALLDSLPSGSGRSDALAWYARGYAEAGLGNRGAAIDALKKAGDKDPAQFGLAYQMAVQAPAEEDLKALFGDAKPGGSPSRSWPLALGGLAAGLILGGGLQRLLAPGKKTSSRTPRRRSPARAGPGAPELAEGEAVISGAYKLMRQIGLGGMGTVYEALDVNLQRPVALKMMRSEIRDDPRERSRFLKEARIVAALRHPNIVEIYAIVEDASELCIVFEYVKGRTLSEVLAERGRLRFPQALEILRAVCGALQYAHGSNVIHRDLKPSNIMITTAGSLKVMDFGVAKQVQDALHRLSRTNTNCGTPGYMAPEMEQGIVSKETDVYSLAVCFYELLTGEMPFAGTGTVLLLNKLNIQFRPACSLVSDLPPGVDEVFLRALQPEPSRRTRTPAEFYAALAALGAPVQSR